MTLKEVRKKISETENPDWFNSVEIQLTFPSINLDFDLKGFSSIYKFFDNQHSGWSQYENLPGAFKTSTDYFRDSIGRIEGFLNSSVSIAGPLDVNWSSVRKTLTRKHNQYFTFDCSETKFLLELNSKFPNSFSFAFHFITGAAMNNINNRDAYIGVISAYEFTQKESGLTGRRSKERISINKLKNGFQKYLNEVEIELVDHLAKSKKEYKEYSETLDTIKQERELIFTNWYSKVSKNFKEFNEKSKQDIDDLRKTYEELLRLKKPAEYWNKRAEILKKEGWRALFWMIGLIILACTPLYFLLWLTPEGMVESLSGNTSSAIKWSVTFVIFISFLAFGIRILNRVVFSTFHLARDAEEREQLTYFYLSLIKESNIKAEEKQLIMQSLFSRADTGLLKEDSSPTMPNDFLSKIISK